MPPSLATLARATRVGLSAARTSEEDRRARADQRAISLLVAALLERSDDAVDVGAHQGLMQQILTAAPEGRHLAVEPVPNHALELRAALPSSVLVEEYAMSDEDREGEMEFLHVTRPTAFTALARSATPATRWRARAAQARRRSRSAVSRCERSPSMRSSSAMASPRA